MIVTAIISEYNPLHDGHRYHIEETRRITECDRLIVIMSGSFTQRGEPAIFSKWSRAEAAVRAGADLVLELPATYAAAGAERFAFGAVSVLNGLDLVNFLSFGSESGDVEYLRRLGTFFADESPAYQSALKQLLDRGVSFPSAREQAAAALLGTDLSSLSLPNDALAVEYIKSLIRTGSAITPVAIKRRGSAYNSTDIAGQFPSALAIRTAMENGMSGAPYSKETPVFAASMFPAVQWALRSASTQYLCGIAEVSEGLEHRLLSSCATARSYAELIGSVKSKRYTMARVKRIVANVFLGITKELNRTIDAAPLYARVLAVKKESSDLLSFLSKTSRIPVVTSPKHTTHPGLLLDIHATDMRSCLLHPSLPSGLDYTTPLLVTESVL